MAKVQGWKGEIGFFEDFLSLDDDSGVTISDAAPLRYNSISLVPISGNVAMDYDETTGGGVATFSGAAGAEDGVALISAPHAPTFGAMTVGCRFQLSVLTTWRAFVGFAETVDKDETVPPFTLSGTTLTDNDAGQCVGMYFDTAATTDDWRFHGSSDGTVFSSGSGVPALGTLGARANATPVAAEWMEVRVEIFPDGSAIGYYGDSSTIKDNGGPKLIGTLKAGTLDATAFYHPLVVLTDPSTTDPTWAVDYFYGTASRDWTV